MSQDDLKSKKTNRIGNKLDEFKSRYHDLIFFIEEKNFNENLKKYEKIKENLENTSIELLGIFNELSKK